MSASALCSEATILLDRVKIAKTNYDQAYGRILTGDHRGSIDAVQKTKTALEHELEILRQFLCPPEVEKIFNLRQQYESQIAILRENGLLQSASRKLASGKEVEYFFIQGIDGKVYPLPSLVDVFKHIADRPELKTLKAEQGFTRLLLVPFGLGLDALLDSYGRYLIKKDLERNNEAFQHIEYINKGTPVMRYFQLSDHIVTALNTNEDIKYFPRQYNEEPGKSSGAVTKAEWLQDRSRTHHWSSGWRMLLVQANSDGGVKMHAYNDEDRMVSGRTNSRPDIVGIQSAADCLRLLQEDKEYAYESGTTPEDWLIAAFTHTEAIGDLPRCLKIDDQVHLIYLTGALYAPSSDSKALTLRWGNFSNPAAYQLVLGNRKAYTRISYGAAQHVVEI